MSKRDEIRDWPGGYRTWDRIRNNEVEWEATVDPAAVASDGQPESTWNGYLPIRFDDGSLDGVLPKAVVPVSRTRWRTGDKARLRYGKVITLGRRHPEIEAIWYAEGSEAPYHLEDAVPVLDDEPEREFQVPAPPSGEHVDFIQDCDRRIAEAMGLPASVLVPDPVCVDCGLVQTIANAPGWGMRKDKVWRCAEHQASPNSVPCASCGEPTDSGAEVNGQPRCQGCAQALIMRREGVHRTTCWCGELTSPSGVAATAAGYGTPRRICRIHGVTSSVKPPDPLTGPAFDHAPHLGARSRDEFLSAIFGT